ncbi:hypothetical protein U2F10_23865 [Leptothoe sp. EHU-05/26/07-4]
MQTLTHKPSSSSSSQPLEFRQTHDTQYVIYLNDLNLGAIAFNITADRWEYRPFSRPVKATGTLEQCKDAALLDLAPEALHHHKYLDSTLASLPHRFHIEHDPALGYRAHFTLLTPTPAPGPDGATQSVAYSTYFPTADEALNAHRDAYIDDVIAYQAFRALLALSERFDGDAVINAFELLKQINPYEDYYLDAAAGRVPPVSAL